jgi:hypothetical protein
LDESDPMEESSDFDKRTALRVSEGADWYSRVILGDHRAASYRKENIARMWCGGVGDSGGRRTEDGGGWRRTAGFLRVWFFGQAQEYKLFKCLLHILINIRCLRKYNKTICLCLSFWTINQYIAAYEASRFSIAFSWTHSSPRQIILIYETWVNLLSIMCICGYLVVFVDFTNTICGFFLDFLRQGSKTVSLIYDTWANLLSIVCICGFFWCIWVCLWILQIRFVDFVWF